MTERITDIELTKTLYKYQDWNNKSHRRLISKQELYFPKPSEFNDPFDGNISVRWDLLSFEEYYEKNLEMMSILLKDKHQSQVKTFVREQTEKSNFSIQINLKKKHLNNLKNGIKLSVFLHYHLLLKIY